MFFQPPSDSPRRALAREGRFALASRPSGNGFAVTVSSFHGEHPVKHPPIQRLCSRCHHVPCQTSGRYCRGCRRAYMREWRALVKARTPARRRYRSPPRIWQVIDREMGGA